MAIAIDASSPAAAAGDDDVAVTGSFSPPANSLLVACVAAKDGTSGTTVTVSNSGTALTWTQRARRDQTDSGGQPGLTAIFTAPCAAGATGITLTASTNRTTGIGVKPYVLTGADFTSPVGATGEGSGTTNAITPTGYTSTVAVSRGIACALECTGAGVITSTDDETAISGAFGDLTGAAVVKAANTATAGTGVTFNLDAAGVSDGKQWNWCAVEIKPLSAFNQTVTVTGVASLEAFGTAQLNFVVKPSGIASGEAFGSLVITTPEVQIISPSGIASDAAFGTLTTKLYLSPMGIASLEAFGAPRLSAVIGPVGIVSGETFGSTNVAWEQFVVPSGIASSEAFGMPGLQLGYPQTIEVEGIESAELVEDPTFTLLHRLVLINPSIQETPAAWHRLFARYGIHRGITILKDASGVWASVRYPSQTEIEEALTVYMGGHRHTLTTTEADELIAAGYAANISLDLIT